MILRLRVWIDLQPVEFEVLFLKVEHEDNFMEKLLQRLPLTICLEFEQLFTRHKALQKLFEKRKVSSRIDDENQSKLKWQEFGKERVSAKEIVETSFQNLELLNQGLYLLNDEEILKEWLIERPKIKEHITNYLQLTSFCYFKELNPEKWRRIVYNFALEFFRDDTTTSKGKFDEKFVLDSYLKAIKEISSNKIRNNE